MPVNVMKPASVNAREIPRTLAMNMIRITELNPPGGQEPIEWILATSLPIKSALEAITVVEYYVQRWKIERFHFVLKSGLGAEKIQRRSYERIKPVLFIYSVIALFIMAITYVGRVQPDAPCSLFFKKMNGRYSIVLFTKLKQLPLSRTPWLTLLNI